MDEKIIYRLWRKYLAATRENTPTEWKKYMLACLRVNVIPPIGRGLDFTTFVGALPYNYIGSHAEDAQVLPVEGVQEVRENEHA